MRRASEEDETLAFVNDYVCVAEGVGGTAVVCVNTQQSSSVCVCCHAGLFRFLMLPFQHFCVSFLSLSQD